MTSERERLERLADEIVDGEEVDWKEVSRSGDPETTRSKLESLRAVEQLREFALSQSAQDLAADASPASKSPATNGEEPRTRSVFDRLSGIVAAFVERIRPGDRD